MENDCASDERLQVGERNGSMIGPLSRFALRSHCDRQFRPGTGLCNIDNAE